MFDDGNYDDGDNDGYYVVSVCLSCISCMLSDLLMQYSS